jgi:hypothetical protein
MRLILKNTVWYYTYIFYDVIGGLVYDDKKHQTPIRFAKWKYFCQSVLKFFNNLLG